ncbi:MAG: DUF4388 domain-containing protein [Myxococcales bacterium]|nr:DUF4388 domain-containing protein [Myxococcales bacterium]
MQRILVCAQDPVLAKKVRFLMERDECKVDILAASGELEARIQEDHPNLVVLSREIDGEDTLDWVANMDASIHAPTLILGGNTRSTADFIHLVPDPVDTQAIYREATRILQSARVYSSLSSGEEESSEPMVDNETNAETAVESVLDGIENELNALANAQHEERLPSTFGSSSSLPMENSMLTTPAAPSKTPISSPPSENDQPLHPDSLAKILHKTWRDKHNGALVVEQSEDQTTIHFEEGRIIAVTFGHKGESLGRSLVERDRINQEQYAAAAIWALEEGRSIAEAITHLGFLTVDALGKELGTSAKEVLASLFTADSGRFWLSQESNFVSSERPYQLEVPHVIAQGLRHKTEISVIETILGDERPGYFRLKRPSYDLQKDFPLSKSDLQLLSYESRAYKLDDAADVAALSIDDAHRLMAVLTVCDEIEPFSPGSKEFEDRIREELETRRELESQLPAKRSETTIVPNEHSPAPIRIEEAPLPTPPQRLNPIQDESASFEIHHDEEIDANTDEDPTHFTFDPEPSENNEEVPHVPTFQADPEPMIPTSAPPPMPGHIKNGVNSEEQEAHNIPIHTTVTPPPAPVDIDIPPMPIPPDGEGSSPRPLSFAKPLPRGADGALLDTPERVISREHFQNGVNLLGKGNFSSAEECFRDAVSLCAEEHVYLIGLARAIYYNPTYRADGKISVLQNIVDRAQALAPDDKRVSTLAAWVNHASSTFI